MRIAGHTVNRGVIPAPPVPPGTFAGVDLDVARARVATEGGDPTLFTNALGWAAAGLDGPPGHDLVLAVSACAAWRAGVVGIRADALRRAGAYAPTAPAAVAGSLLIAPDALPGFLSAQADDPFAWVAPLPERVVASIGGFAGLGGPWLRPPTAFGRLGGPQDLWVAADGRLVRVRADIFGHRLAPLAGEAPGDLDRPGARLERAAEHSYLLRVFA